jgi:hypothetical protein
MAIGAVHYEMTLGSLALADCDQPRDVLLAYPLRYQVSALSPHSAMRTTATVDRSVVHWPVEKPD